MPISPLIRYAKRGLRNCFLPEQNCWSAVYHLDGRAQPNQSRPRYNVFYSLNVILGLASLGEEAWKDEYDLRSLFHQNTRRLVSGPALTYAYGMALWTSAVLGEPLAADVNRKISDFVNDRHRWPHFCAQDVAMILIGFCEQHKKGYADYKEGAIALFSFLKEHYACETHLFYNASRGLRRNFSSFATQAYLTTACYHFGETFGSEEALRLADDSARKMFSLQGANGEWPWFYYAPKGIVVDFYEVYSVHQDGMAPLFLSFAEKRGIEGAREAIIKGFNVVFGQNQLGKSMLIPSLGLFYRSILRKGEYRCKTWRVFRSVVNAVLGRSDSYADAGRLFFRNEDRSYHLAWVLYSFGRRDDLPEITHNQAFIDALK